MKKGELALVLRKMLQETSLVGALRLNRPNMPHIKSSELEEAAHRCSICGASTQTDVLRKPFHSRNFK